MYGRSPCGSVDWNIGGDVEVFFDGGRSPCGSVDWNRIVSPLTIMALLSLPMWERGLKPSRRATNRSATSRSPCGSVDWNQAEVAQRRQQTVAPHVGAWIETVLTDSVIKFRTVAPHVGAWIETITNASFGCRSSSRSPCGSVDWNKELLIMWYNR